MAPAETVLPQGLGLEVSMALTETSLPFGLGPCYETMACRQVQGSVCPASA